MTTHLTRRGLRGLATASAITMALLLGGCSTSGENYDNDAATRLQERVAVATSSAAAGNHATSLTALAELEVELRDALARGLITQERFDSITAAIALVRADLDAAIAETTPPPEESDDDEAPANDKGRGNDKKKD